MRLLRLALSAIHGRVGGGIDDELRALSGHPLAYGDLIADVELAMPEGRDPRGARRGSDDGLSHLPARAGEKHPHG